jgi:hypothetical protein
VIDDYTINATGGGGGGGGTGTPVTFIPQNANWKYLDDGSNQGTTWRSLSFGDSTWKSGNAELGYGDGDEATVVGFGGNANNKFVTTYFRKNFSISDASQITSLNLSIKRDDGAVVYLNGTEVYRTNMPGGSIASSTFASSAIEDNTFFSASIPTSLLSSGNNVIAVEVHQSDAGSSDVSFNFALTGTTTGSVQNPPSAPTNLSATAVSSSRIDLTWDDNSGSETNYIVERSLTGTGSWSQVASLAANVTSYSDTGLNASTTYFYRVHATNSGGDSANTNVDSATTEPSGTSTTVTYIPTGSNWKYLDNGSNQGTTWRAVGFSDSTWKSGNAELGYGDGDEATVVGFGSNAANKFVTTYFRTSFSVSDPSAVSALSLRIKRDDGAVVYLNGTEVYRTNMTTGTIAYTTRASSAIEDNSYFTATINPALLTAGTNVIAVEIHQADPASSDISFDFELKGTVSGGTVTQPEPPTGGTTVPAPWTDGDIGSGGVAGSATFDGSTFTVKGLRQRHLVRRRRTALRLPAALRRRDDRREGRRRDEHQLLGQSRRHDARLPRRRGQASLNDRFRRQRNRLPLPHRHRWRQRRCVRRRRGAALGQADPLRQPLHGLPVEQRLDLDAGRLAEHLDGIDDLHRPGGDGEEQRGAQHRDVQQRRDHRLDQRGDVDVAEPHDVGGDVLNHVDHGFVVDDDYEEEESGGRSGLIPRAVRSPSRTVRPAGRPRRRGSRRTAASRSRS